MNITKEEFLKYERTRIIGKYNMYMQREEAANEAGLPIEKYNYIIDNYKGFYQKYQHECEALQREVFHNMLYSW